MATTFNFTVRAEDDQGAFADRDFSMTVRNTMVDRYMVVDATDAYTSPDMVTWTKRAGQGGNAVSYGGGKWLITPIVNASSYRLSVDGVNFASYPLAVPGYTGAYTAHPPVWNIDRWWVTMVAQATGVYHNLSMYSLDGINWTLIAKSPAASVILGSSMPSFADGKVFYAANNSAKHYWFDASATDVVNMSETAPNLPAHTGVGSSITYSPPIKINDLWIILALGTSGMMSLYSTDRVVWGAGPLLPQANFANRKLDSISYHNGKLIGSGYHSTTNSLAGHTVLSVDGKTWTSSNTAGATGTGNLRQYVVSTKGKIYVTSGLTKYSSSDIGVTWTLEPESFPTGVNTTGFATIQ